MTFTFDGDPQVRHTPCQQCGRGHEIVTGFVLRGGDAYAVYFAHWYPHTERRISTWSLAVR